MPEKVMTMFDDSAAATGDAQGALYLGALPDIDRLFTALGLAGPEERGLVLAALGVLLAGALLLGALMLGKRGRGRVTGAALAELTRGPRRLGYAAAFVLVAVFGGWSVLAPLASAAIAPGVVSPDGNRKTVEHLEGGIVRSILVREGDMVRSGAPLVILDDVQARAQFDQMHERLLFLLATRARLEAERADAADIVFPPELSAAHEPGARKAIVAQRDLLASRRASQASREDILSRRIRQLEEQNDGLREVIVAEETQVALIAEEIDGVDKLYKKGLEKYPRLLALHRAQAELEAQKAANRARIAENEQRIGETQIQLLTQREQVLEKANDELAEVERQIAEISSQMPSRADILERTVIRAPIDGTVMNILATTVTGVIRAGAPILEIVPQDASLVIDAQVRPNDIDRVQPGMRARVVLTAFQQRNLPLIHGTLRSVSADRLVEDRSGEPYFLAKVEVDPEELAQLHDIKLVPGMPAEVMILNGERTLIDYMLGPIFQSLNRSFKSG